MAEHTLESRTEPNESKAPLNPMPIIGIGASAGGLNALKSFFKNVNLDTNCCFVLVQHLSPDHKSLMKGLLSKITDLLIVEASDDIVLEPRTIYLIPPKMNVILRGRQLHLLDKPLARTLNLPIDQFFESMATELGHNAVGIILSGTGSDGTQGIHEISSRGGMVMVQNPEDAEFDGMPNSAIETKQVDYILKASEMPGILENYLANPSIRNSLEHEIGKDRGKLSKLISHIHNVTDMNFSVYKPPTMIRRISRRVENLNFKSLDEYYDYALKKHSEVELLANDLLISVTEFFRNPEVWENLRDNIIPKIVSEKSEGDTVKVWSVGCSTGQEAFSIAMLFSEELDRQKKRNINFRVFASDLSHVFIRRASSGIYEARDAEAIPRGLREKYLERIEDKYQIKATLRKHVIFSQHDILKNPPFGKVDLVLCRNLLIYLNAQAQEQTLNSLHYALRLGGILVLGKSENMGKLEKYFDDFSETDKIYVNNIQNKSFAITNLTHSFNSSYSGSSSFDLVTSLSMNRRDKGGESRRILEYLAGEFNLAYVQLNGEFKITEAIGKFKRYLKIPESGFSSTLPDLLEDNVRSAVRLALLNAYRTYQKIKLDRVRFEQSDQPFESDILIIPLEGSGTGSDIEFLVIFSPSESKKAGFMAFDLDLSHPGSSLGLREMELELSEAKETLIKMQHEVEIKNEELQASNEELIATNEELQSANEELQSVNEELHTVNAELNEKVTQLGSSNDTIDNILKSSTINMLVLDKNHRIRKYTDGIRNHINLSHTDLERPITDFSSTFRMDIREMVKMAKEVGLSGDSMETEIADEWNAWYLMKISPFRTSDERIDGVVITFTNIERIKRAEFSAKQAKDEFQSLFNHVPEFLVIVDRDQKILQVNHSFTNILGYTENDVIMRDLGEFTVRMDDRYDIMNASVTDTDQRSLQGIRARDGRVIPVRLKSSNLFDKKGDLQYMLLSYRDISDLMDAERLFMDKSMAFEQVIEGTLAGYWDWNLREGSSYLSPTFKAMFGYKDQEMENSPESWMGIVHPDDLPNLKEVLRKHIDSRGQVPYDNTIRFFHKNGSIVWVYARGKVIEWDESTGEAIRMVGSHVNVTDLVNKTEQLEQLTYVASHDLQEPLRTIIDFVKLLELESESLNQEQEKYIEFIKEAGERMLELVRDILDFSRSGKRQKIEDVDLNQIFNKVKGDLSSKIENGKVSLEADRLPVIKADSSEIYSLFINLIGNGIKFQAEGSQPEIRVRHFEVSDHHVLAFVDNGIGIPQDKADKIFKIFTRLNNRSEYEGNGIGLAHCKKIVELYGGRIEVKSEPGLGSEFYVYLNKKYVE